MGVFDHTAARTAFLRAPHSAAALRSRVRTRCAPPADAGRQYVGWVQKLVGGGREHLLLPQLVLSERRWRCCSRGLLHSLTMALAPHAVRWHVPVRVRPEVWCQRTRPQQQLVHEDLHAVHAVLGVIEAGVELLEHAAWHVHSALVCVLVSFLVHCLVREWHADKHARNAARARFPQRLCVECVLRVLHAVAAHRHVRRRREELSCMQLGSLLCSKQHGRADAISPEFLPQESGYKHLFDT